MSTPVELLRAGGWRLGHHGGDPRQPYWEHHGRYPGVAFDVYAALADECHQLRAALERAGEVERLGKEHIQQLRELVDAREADLCKERDLHQVTGRHLERVTAERDKLREMYSDSNLARVTAERDEAIHDYGGFARELTEVRAALTEERIQHTRACQDLHEARAELAQLRRAWALRELEACALVGRELMRKLPESVADLIRAGAGKRIETCRRCENRSPCDYVMADWQCCQGWGCSEKGASDGG